MPDDEVANRLTRLELAVAHLTEAVEELARIEGRAGAASASLIDSHLRDIRENFNRFAPKGSGA